MWGSMCDATGAAAEDPPATPPGQPPTPLGPPSPVTPPSLLPRVDPNRQSAGGRPFIWPRQPGEVARQSPHDLLSGHGNGVKLMQDTYMEVLRLMFQTDFHLEAAMGRNLGNTVCEHPEMLPQTVEHMARTFKVPYSLYEISLRFVCLYDQLGAT